MKKESISQKRIREIADLCYSAGVPFIVESPICSSRHRRNIVIMYLGGYPLIYTLKAFLSLRSNIESLAHVSRVVLSDILV